MPQLALTLNNAVIVTASLSRELFPLKAAARRLFHARRSGWPVIGIAALVTLTVNSAAGLGARWAAELVRAALVRRFLPRAAP